MQADDGNHIEASKATSDMQVTIKGKKGHIVDQCGSNLLPKGFSNTAGSHGVTFAKGQVWINKGPGEGTAWRDAGANLTYYHRQQ